MFRTLGEAKYLQVEVRDDFTGQDKWIYEDSTKKLPLCFGNYIVTDGIEQYRIPISHEERYSEGRIRTYNQIVNFKDRVYAWKNFIDKVYLRLVTRSKEVSLMGNVVWGDGEFFKNRRKIQGEIDDKIALDLVCSVPPINSVLDFIKNVRRTENIFWIDNFSIEVENEKDRKWNDETFTWEIDGFTWNPLTKDWEKI